MVSIERQEEVLQSVASQLSQLFDLDVGGWAVVRLGETAALVRTNNVRGEIHLVISHGRDEYGSPVR